MKTVSSLVLTLATAATAIVVPAANPTPTSTSTTSDANDTATSTVHHLRSRETFQLRCGLANDQLTNYCEYYGGTWCDRIGRPNTRDQRRCAYPICVCVFYGTCRRSGCSAEVLAALEAGGLADDGGFDDDTEYEYATDADGDVVDVRLVVPAGEADEKGA